MTGTGNGARRGANRVGANRVGANRVGANRVRAGSGLRIRIRQIVLRLVLCGIQFSGPLQEADDQTVLGLTEVVDHFAQVIYLVVDGVSKKGTEHAKRAAAHLPLRSTRNRRTLVDGAGEATDLA